MRGLIVVLACATLVVYAQMDQKADSIQLEDETALTHREHSPEEQLSATLSNDNANTPMRKMLAKQRTRKPRPPPVLEEQEEDAQPQQQQQQEPVEEEDQLAIIRQQRQPRARGATKRIPNKKGPNSKQHQQQFARAKKQAKSLIDDISRARRHHREHLNDKLGKNRAGNNKRPLKPIPQVVPEEVEESDNNDSDDDDDDESDSQQDDAAENAQPLFHHNAGGDAAGAAGSGPNRNEDAGGDESERSENLGEQFALKRQAELLLVKEKERAHAIERQEKDRVRLAERAAEEAHLAHKHSAKNARAKVDEAQAAFNHAEHLIKHAEDVGLKEQQVHDQALKLAHMGGVATHKSLADKLDVEEKRLAMQRKKDVIQAQEELERAHLAHQQAVRSEKEAQMMEDKEHAAEVARAKAHGNVQRAHLEGLVLDRLHGSDLLRAEHLSPIEQAEVRKFEAQRQMMDQRHQRSRDEMQGVPAQVPLADAQPRAGNFEEYHVMANDEHDRGNFIQCPLYQGMPCGGPSRGTCDRLTGTCNCNMGVGAAGGYFGIACECGWTKNKCNPPECHWCVPMNTCVKDRATCLKKPHGREGPLYDGTNAGDTGDDDHPIDPRSANHLHRSESVQNEHHKLVAHDQGVHDHSKSMRPQGGVQPNVLDQQQETGELTEPQEGTSSTGIIVVLCLLLFTVVMIIGAYLGFAPKTKPREDTPMSSLDGSASGERSGGPRRRQAARDE